MTDSLASLQNVFAFALHIAIIVTLLSACGSLVEILARRKPATVRYALMFGLLMGICVAPIIIAVYHWQLLPSVTRSTPSQRPAASAPMVDGDGRAIDAEITPSGAAVSPSGIDVRQLLGAAFLSVWLVGIAVRVGQGYRASRPLRCLWLTLRPLKNCQASAALTRLQSEVGVTGLVRLATTTLAPCPFTTGIFRSMIVLPERFVEQATTAQLDAAMIHELVHVKRRDAAWHAIGEALDVIYWWCPWVGRINAALVRASEEICDSHVIRIQQNGETLASVLCECLRTAALPSMWVVGMSRGSTADLKVRMNQLLSGHIKPMLHLTHPAAGLLGVWPLVILLLFVHAEYARAELMFGTPVNLGPAINSTDWDAGPSISSDGTTLYFASRRSGTLDIYESQRDSISSSWQSAEPISTLSSDAQRNESAPTVTEDELLMAYYVNSPNVQSDIYTSTRSSISDAWGDPVSLGAPINTDGNDRHPNLSPDGLTLYFASSRHGTPTDGEVLDIYVATRLSRDVPFGEPTSLGNAVNSDRNDAGPSISTDGLRLFFHSTRDSVSVEAPYDQDIFYTERAAIDKPWTAAVKLDSIVNSAAPESSPSISADGRTLYFSRWTSNTLSSGDLFSVAIVPEPSAGTMAVAGSLLLLGGAPRRRLRWARDAAVAALKHQTSGGKSV